MNQETTSDTPETNKFRASLDGMREINQRDRLLSHARRLERERDEWQLCALMKMAVKKLACMWCGEIVHAPTGYEPGTPLSEDQRRQAYREHVAICTAHPIREVERERDEARESLAATEAWSALLAEVGDNFRAENAELRAAIRNLRDVKGRHHTQIATEQLFALLPENAKSDAPT